jgi:hypothetical protein
VEINFNFYVHIDSVGQIFGDLNQKGFKSRFKSCFDDFDFDLNHFKILRFLI